MCGESYAAEQEVGAREGPAQLEPLDSVRERPALAKLGVGAPVGPVSLPPEVSVRWGPVHQLPVKPPVSLSPRQLRSH